MRSAESWEDDVERATLSSASDALARCIRRIQADASKAGGWIACSERMAPDDQYVIAHSPAHGVVPTVAAWDEKRDGWFTWEGGYLETNHVTHWMPLPAPPAADRETGEG